MSARCVECVLVDGVRYEANGPVPVRVCFNCGTETPPFGACCERQTPPNVLPIPERNCAQCGEPVTLHFPADSRRFCSPACAAASQRVIKVSVTCPCGAEFEVLPSLYKPNPITGFRRGVYCSKSCSARRLGQAS